MRLSRPGRGQRASSGGERPGGGGFYSRRRVLAGARGGAAGRPGYRGRGLCGQECAGAATACLGRAGAWRRRG